MSSSPTKDLVRALEASGYEVRLNRKGGHYTAFRTEGGRTIQVVFSQSPSDHHAVKNACGDLRRHGFKFNFGGKSYG